MNRFHIHISVRDLDQSLRFYSALFGAEPSVHKNDYVKWDIDDPAVNFAISSRSHKPGLDHAGIQTGSQDALMAIRERLEAAPGARGFYSPVGRY